MKNNNILKIAGLIALVLLPIVIWEFQSMQNEFPYIAQVLETYISAWKNQDLALASSQLLSPEEGGKIPVDEVLINMTSGKHLHQHIQKTELDRRSLRIFPRFANRRIVKVAYVEGSILLDGGSAAYFAATLQEQDNRWYIVEIQETGFRKK